MIQTTTDNFIKFIKNQVSNQLKRTYKEEEHFYFLMKLFLFHLSTNAKNLIIKQKKRKKKEKQ